MDQIRAIRAVLEAAATLEEFTSATVLGAFKELAKLEADARALWAVRVLDAWACKHEHVKVGRNIAMWEMVRLTGPTEWAVRLYEGKWVYHHKGPTPDAARIAAADALLAEDQSLGEGL